MLFSISPFFILRHIFAAAMLFTPLRCFLTLMMIIFADAAISAFDTPQRRFIDDTAVTPAMPLLPAAFFPRAAAITPADASPLLFSSPMADAAIHYFHFAAAFHYFSFFSDYLLRFFSLFY
jgi:hypothetical protein